MLKGYVEGKDTVSGKPMMQAIVDASHQPAHRSRKKMSGIPAEAGAGSRGCFRLPRKTICNACFKENGWTDYNPGHHSHARNEWLSMLKGTSHKPDEIVKSAAGTFGTRRPFTVEKVAALAVMAGAKPEYFPVILGARRAWCRIRTPQPPSRRWLW